MPNCDFYALGPDLIEVLGFIFAQPGWTLIDNASIPDQPLRTFRSVEEVCSATPDLTLPGSQNCFHLYAPEMKGTLGTRRIDFVPGAVPGATHRFVSEGWGLIQLRCGWLRERRLSNSHTNHFSARGAAKWAPVRDEVATPDDWDWAAVTRVSSRLNRHIRTMAVEKKFSRPVMRAASAAQAKGDIELAFP